MESSSFVPPNGSFRKIVIIEDNHYIYIAESWATIINFERDLRAIAQFASMEDAVNSAEVKQAEVGILDIELPGMSGVDGVAKLKEMNPALLIIMATVHEEDVNIFNSLRNGAIGYLSKKSVDDGTGPIYSHCH